VLAFEVVDDFTSYGLVAIGIISDNSIIQFVMSCRVIGLGVEETAIAEINRFLLESGYNEMYGRFEKSAANDVCKDLFEKTGFIFAAELWRKATVPCLTSPAHVKVK
jgi:predicted enzyme involved in methoxymalonyl-ACP biosynthesis